MNGWATGRTAALVGLLLAAAVAGWAHKLVRADVVPDSPANAVRLEDHRVSIVYYSEVNPQRPETWFVFEAQAGDSIYMSLGVPLIDRLAGFRPRLALVGPGLPRAGLPFANPPDVPAGAVIVQPAAEPAEYHEPVTDTYSWRLADATIEAPENGTYYVVAYAVGPLPPRPKLWVAVGTRERFTLRDILSIGEWRRYVREFHETGRRGR